MATSYYGYFLALSIELPNATDRVIARAYYEDPNEAGTYVEAFHVEDNAPENSGTVHYVLCGMKKAVTDVGVVQITKLDLDFYHSGATVPYGTKTYDTSGLLLGG